MMKWWYDATGDGSRSLSVQSYKVSRTRKQFVAQLSTKVVISFKSCQLVTTGIIPGKVDSCVAQLRWRLYLSLHTTYDIISFIGCENLKMPFFLKL